MPAVCGAAPFNTSQRAAFSDTTLPQDATVIVGVQGIDDARFLRCQKDPSTVRQRLQDWRSAEIIIITTLSRAVISLLGNASTIPDVLGHQLAPPQPLSGDHIERHDGV